MTIPNLMNCPHQGEGWCLKCVRELYQLYSYENPADDGEPITDEWLESVGFKDDDHGTVGIDYLWINDGADSGFDLQVWRGRGWWIADSENDIHLKSQNTRGEVRLLCRALGIELKEQK